MKNRLIFSFQKEIPDKGVKFCFYKICEDSDSSPFLKTEEGEQPEGKSCRFSLDQIEGWPAVEELEELLHGSWQENVL